MNRRCRWDLLVPVNATTAKWNKAAYVIKRLKKRSLFSDNPNSFLASLHSLFTKYWIIFRIALLLPLRNSFYKIETPQRFMSSQSFSFFPFPLDPPIDIDWVLH